LELQQPLLKQRLLVASESACLAAGGQEFPVRIAEMVAAAQDAEAAKCDLEAQLKVLEGRLEEEKAKALEEEHVKSSTVAALERQVALKAKLLGEKDSAAAAIALEWSGHAVSTNSVIERARRLKRMQKEKLAALACAEGQEAPSEGGAEASALSKGTAISHMHGEGVQGERQLRSPTSRERLRASMQADLEEPSRFFDKTTGEVRGKNELFARSADNKKRLRVTRFRKLLIPVVSHFGLCRQFRGIAQWRLNQQQGGSEEARLQRQWKEDEEKRARLAELRHQRAIVIFGTLGKETAMNRCRGAVGHWVKHLRGQTANSRAIWEMAIHCSNRSKTTQFQQEAWFWKFRGLMKTEELIGAQQELGQLRQLQKTGVAFAVAHRWQSLVIDAVGGWKRRTVMHQARTLGHALLVAQERYDEDNSEWRHNYTAMRDKAATRKISHALERQEFRTLAGRVLLWRGEALREIGSRRVVRRQLELVAYREVFLQRVMLYRMRDQTQFMLTKALRIMKRQFEDALFLAVRASHLRIAKDCTEALAKYLRSHAVSTVVRVFGCWRWQAVANCLRVWREGIDEAVSAHMLEHHRQLNACLQE